MSGAFPHPSVALLRGNKALADQLWDAGRTVGEWPGDIRAALSALAAVDSGSDQDGLAYQQTIRDWLAENQRPMPGLDDRRAASIRKVMESKAALLFSPLGLRGLFPSNKVSLKLKHKATKERPASVLELETPQTRLADAAAPITKQET